MPCATLTKCLLAVTLLPLALADIYMQVNDGSKNVFQEAFTINSNQQNTNMGSLSALNGAIKVSDFSIGAAQSYLQSTSPSVGGSKLNFQGLSVSKITDQYSPLLFNLMVRANTKLTVTIGFSKTTGQSPAPQIYSVYTFTGAAVQSLTQAVNDVPGEDVLTFLFSTIANKQAGQAPDGTLKTPNTFSWDLANSRVLN